MLTDTAKPLDYRRIIVATPEITNADQVGINAETGHVWPQPGWNASLLKEIF